MQATEERAAVADIYSKPSVNQLQKGLLRAWHLALTFFTGFRNHPSSKECRTEILPMSLQALETVEDNCSTIDEEITSFE